MAKSKQITNIKIPYPTEGLIQSDQMSDSVAPEQSVSSAVNVVFDRIGAVMTRLGNKEFATQLTGEIITLGKYLKSTLAERRLIAQVGNKLNSWNGTTWTEVRTLASTNKARYSQFLNYLYTVNGSGASGDPIQTFNGTSYSATNVGSLPKGDFVQAGFEGRVWVADATLDRLYYSNIVDLAGLITGGTDYIEKLSPQDGESITGLFRVPRALLVFKENHIYRVYGATSVDPYPAYNVGTFSQESIIETKQGIFFHHSSGFYWFKYDGQPQEISRRIKGYVNAIPRSYYSKVSGAYDGKDSVTWSVGEVTVEGVIYKNCQLRYSISTQVWTAYDLKDLSPTAMISYDSGNLIAQVMGDKDGKVMQQEVGLSDNGKEFYFEFTTRWLSFVEMWSLKKSITGIMVNSEFGAGVQVFSQSDNDLTTEWSEVGTLTQDFSSLFPNYNTGDEFNRIRFRISGFTKGERFIYLGTELASILPFGTEYN